MEQHSQQNTNKSVDFVRTEIEKCLLIIYTQGRTPLKTSSPILSSYAWNSQVVSEHLNYQCGDASRALFEEITKNTKLKAHLGQSLDRLGIHLYIVINFNGIEIIIDPTIGQFLEGYNRVFVGTRQQLKELFFNHTGPLLSYQFSPYWMNKMGLSFNSVDREHWWHLIWGNHSYIHP